MAQPLMPKATAVWLIENTALRFEQIADFCNLHVLEVQSIADDELVTGMVGYDPIANNQLTQEEIDRCTADATGRLELAKPNVPLPEPRTKGPRYTPVARRQDRPDGISWLLRNFPELSDGQISRLVGTTKPTINAIRERTHWNISNIKPQDPVSLSLCGRQELAEAIEKARRAADRAAKRAERETRRAEAAEAAPAEQTPVEPVETTTAAEPVPEMVTAEPEAQQPAPPEPAPVDPVGGGTEPDQPTAPADNPGTQGPE